MVETTQKPIKPAGSEPSVAVQPTETAISLQGRSRPIVVRVKGKKGKKRKYSRGTKDLQIGLRKGSKIGDRIASALSDGFGLYRKKSNKSSRKRKDGMLRDLFKNSGSGLGKTMRKSSKVPVLIAKTVRGKSVRRSIRAMSRMMGGR